MLLFPAIATVVALACASFVGWDAVRHPRPERVTWALAFLIFAVAAGSEFAGSVIGWSATLARIYYLTGAVIVVGLLALGELYLLAPSRMPAVAPGIALLVVAIAATTVWSAPVDPTRLQADGWSAIERGPFLVGLAATINAGGTLVLAGGALYSAWKLERAGGSGRRAAGCVMIALGTIVVASGGTLTRFGNREFLYLAMALGISIIFVGVVLIRGGFHARVSRDGAAPAQQSVSEPVRRAWLIPLPTRQEQIEAGRDRGAGVRFVVSNLLPLDEREIEAACRRWSATALDGDVLTRSQARLVWALRLALPPEAIDKFDGLPMPLQAQLGELFAEIWSDEAPAASRERHA